MSWFYKFFSRFTDSTEAQIYHWLHAVFQHKTQAKQQAEAWLQQDAARLTLLLEWKFKGYKHLTKGYRRKCYVHLETLKTDFLCFVGTKKNINATGYLDLINQYIHHNKLDYRAGSSFDKLCVDPQKNTLVGDCNQLVVLYIYLFSLCYPVKKLQLKLMPRHVCLHFNQKDYETTSGKITVYKKFNYLVPVTEIIAITLQDVADTENRHSLPAENRLQCAQLALIFTKYKQLANQNIKTSAKALLIQNLELKKWQKALFYADLLKNKQLKNLVHEQQGFAAINAKSFKKARFLFTKISSQKGLNATDQAEIVYLLELVKNYKTMQKIRQHKTKVRRILTLAKRSNRPKLIKWCKALLK